MAQTGQENQRNSDKRVVASDELFNKLRDGEEIDLSDESIFEEVDDDVNIAGKQRGDSKELSDHIKKLEDELAKAKGGYSGATKQSKKLEEEVKLLRSQLDEVRNSGNGNEKKPGDLYEALGIDKDTFVMDIDEAFRDKNSDSAKVLNAYTAAMSRQQAQELLKQLGKERNEETQREKFEREKVELMKETGMTEDEFDEWIEKASKVPASLKNLYMLTNTGDIINRAVQKKNVDSGKQRDFAARFPTILGNKGGGQQKLNISDLVQDALIDGDDRIDLSSL